MPESSTSVSANQPPLCHSHAFAQHNPLAEKNTRRALALTVVMMTIEIWGGWYFNSMALLADGWHMSSHVVALGLTLLAYLLARRFAKDNRFAFGTWKIEVLGGYTSAILLMLVALSMLYQSTLRLFMPVEIHYDEAIGIATIGLLVNLACAWLLHNSNDHGHDHSHAHHHSHDHHRKDDQHKDLNLHSAYVHVITDALTSVLAIIALCGGKIWGAAWLDPVMGIVGGVLVAIWAMGLLRDTSRALLDAEMDTPVVAEIREVIANSSTPAEIHDLHVWRVGREKYACILTLQTTRTDPVFFKQQLQIHEELVHITVEIVTAE